MTKKESIESKIIQNNLVKIRKGDKVKMVSRPEIDMNCWEAEKHRDEIFNVLDGPTEICGSWCVKIDKHGWFDILFLEKVDTEIHDREEQETN